jgi:hypothetical protein
MRVRLRSRPFGSWPALLVGVTVVSSALASAAGASSTAHQARDGLRVSAPGASNRPLYTAIVDPASLGGYESAIAHEHARRTGARYLLVLVNWADVAPRGSRPSMFSPRNPADPNYHWALTDDQVRMAVATGFIPIVYVQTAPAWAQGCSQGPGPCRPSPGDLADFMTAAARRYRGGYRGLPRVRFWQIWNEPNLNWYLMPQADATGQLLSPEVYRGMVNAAYVAIHGVHADNVVIAGGTAPFGNDDNQVDEVSPLLFMRKLLCLSTGSRPRPVCRKRIRFDVWAHHPYTSGSPTHHASLPDDVSVPDLWKMRVLLDAAVEQGNLQSRGPVGFWVTEFGWDTNPPDRNGVPEPLQARWVAEALYRMWDQGVSLVTWFLLRDKARTFQSGLYFRGPSGISSDKPKLTLTAFRFPFVAFREPKTKSIWGRSPQGSAAVVVDLQVEDKQRVVTRMRPNRHGIFSGRFPSTATTGFVDARLVDGSDAALPFSLVVPPDRPGCAFGTC